MVFAYFRIVFLTYRRNYSNRPIFSAVTINGELFLYIFSITVSLQMLLLYLASFYLLKLGPWSHTSKRSEVCPWLFALRVALILLTCHWLYIFNHWSYTCQ